MDDPEDEDEARTQANDSTVKKTKALEGVLEYGRRDGAHDKRNPSQTQAAPGVGERPNLGINGASDIL